MANDYPGWQSAYLVRRTLLAEVRAAAWSSRQLRGLLSASCISALAADLGVSAYWALTALPNRLVFYKGAIYFAFDESVTIPKGAVTHRLVAPEPIDTTAVMCMGCSATGWPSVVDIAGYYAVMTIPSGYFLETPDGPFYYCDTCVKTFNGSPSIATERSVSTESIERVFQVWQQSLADIGIQSKLTLTENRRRLIRSRMKVFGEEMVCRALKEWTTSSWHVQNSVWKLEILLKESNIERFGSALEDANRGGATW